MNSRNDLLQTITKAIHIVMASEMSAISEKTFLSQDLRLESIDLVDLSFELEHLLGKEIGFAEVFRHASKKSKDLQVSDIINFLKANK